MSVAFSRVRRSLLTLTGKDVQDFLNRMSTNDLSTLREGENRPTVFTNEKGRIVDIVHVTRTPTGAILTCSPGVTAHLPEWLERFIIMDDVQVTDRQQRDYILLMGPDSPGIATRLADTSPGGAAIRDDLGTITAFLIPGRGDLAGHPEIDASTFETLRVEEGVPGYGHEITTDFNPLEAGLKKYISFTKGCYIGQEVIARLDTYKKLRRILTPFEFPDYTGSTLAPGKIVHDGGNAGIVTSTAFSATRGEWIGLGYRRLKSDSGGLVLNPDDGSAPVGARCLKKLPDDYDGYEIAGDDE